jgi:hypothetical protein
VEAPGIEPGPRRPLAWVTSVSGHGIEADMGLSRALSMSALALLSCGGRSGLLGLEESNSGGTPRGGLPRCRAQ